MNGYRVMFDLKPKAGSREPINLRVFLRADGRALSGDLAVPVVAAGG